MEAGDYRKRAASSSESESDVESSSENVSDQEDASGVNFEFEIDVSNEWHDFVMVNKDVMLYGERHNGNNPATINDLLISEVLSTAQLRRDVSTQAHFTYNIDYMNSTQMVIDQILLEDVFTILHPLVFTISDLIQLLQTIIRIQTLNIGIFDSR